MVKSEAIGNILNDDSFKEAMADKRSDFYEVS